MEHFLGKQSWRICFSLALLMTAIQSAHIARDAVIPFLDGEGYAIRAFALDGDLHTGQWHAFWELLRRPNQSILAPHDVLFFLLPVGWAGTVSYAVLQFATTYVLLAYAIVKAATVLNRPAWAPVVFLLVGVNNIALNDSYAFYRDVMFCASGLLVIALQMEAWKENRAGASLLSGAVLGLLFFLKPANALVFLATYVLSEVFYSVAVLRSGEARDDRRASCWNLLRQGGYRCVGFIPVIAVVFLFGGAQSILQLIDRNEMTEAFSPIAVGGLPRLLYFPLCLAVYYHVLLLGGLILAAVAFSRWRPDPCAHPSARSFPTQLLLPAALSYLVLGEFFSFWPVAKPVRALMVMLPVCGLVVCWLWESRRLRLAPLACVAVIYAGAAFSQKAFDLMGARDHLVEDNYQLTWSSLAEMPSPWHRGSGLNLSICDCLRRDAPPAGIICVSAIELRDELRWRLNNQPLLLGQMPPYEVRSLFNYKGEYYERALNGAVLVSLITFRPVQSSRAEWLEAMGMLSYGNDEWCGKGLARLTGMPSVRGEPIGYDFVFDHPLSPADVERVNQSAALAGAQKDPTLPPDTFYGRHYAQAQAWRLLREWFDKRF